MLLIVAARVVQLQMSPDPRVLAEATPPSGVHALPARRGTIYDRMGRPLAISRLGHRLFADPALIEDRALFPMIVAHCLGLDPATVDALIRARERTRYVVLSERLTDEQYAAYREMRGQRGDGYRALGVEPVVFRDYPQGDLAGQLIGMVGRDDVDAHSGQRRQGRGLEGLESAREAHLAAYDGRLRYTRDPAFRPLWLDAEQFTPPHDGEPLTLAIDAEIQRIAEDALATQVRKYHAKAGQAVVMDPHTGEVLAMANVPVIGPRGFLNPDTPESDRRNRCVTDVFEPGSIFKPVVWSLLTDRGTVRVGERFDCGPGVMRLPFGRTLRDAHPIHEAPWTDVLVYSSNIGMAQAALRTTPRALHEGIARFGFGAATRCGAPGEVDGFFRDADDWDNYTLTSVPMGQEITVNAVQIARAYSAIANDGVLPTATILALPDDALARGLIADRVIRADTAKLVRTTLQRVVDEHPLKWAISDRYTIWGKSGTAQLPDPINGGYFQDRYLSSFVAGAPTATPRLVVGVHVHDPDRALGHYGAQVAGPACKAILEQALAYLGIPGDKPTDTAADEPADQRG